MNTCMNTSITQIHVCYKVGSLAVETIREIVDALSDIPRLGYAPGEIILSYVSLEDFIAHAAQHGERIKSALQAVKVGHLSVAQHGALSDLCSRYKHRFSADDFRPAFDLPEGWVQGVVGPITVGCSPSGEIAS